MRAVVDGVEGMTASLAQGSLQRPMDIVEVGMAHAAERNAPLVCHEDGDGTNVMDGWEDHEDIIEQLELLPTSHIVVDATSIDDSVAVEEDRCTRHRCGAGRVVVIEVDIQHVHRADAVRVGGKGRGILVEHSEARIVLRQVEPHPAGGDHRRVELHRGRAHAQVAVAEAGDGARPESQLDGVAVGHVLGVAQQQPHHHALDVLELQGVGFAHPHRALHPRRAEVQVAHAILLGQGDGGEFGFIGSQLARGGFCRRPGRTGRFFFFDGFTFDQHKGR